MADRSGQQLGKYRLTRLLGQGGFAEVYLASHIHLGTEAAIKLLHTQLATPGDIEKFRQESQTIARLVHPNIVRVLDFDVADGVPYLVMDYAPNGSLRQHVPAGQRLSPQEVLTYLSQIGDALQYAHDQKLVHRDIKPENMLLGRRSELLLTDFGIAVTAQSTSMQQTMGVAGTAAYMSPEQLHGKPRPASDLYSLAVVVYEWLSGERPFQGSFTEVASQHLFSPPPPLREKLPDLSPAVEQVVLTALEKEPKNRFGSVRAFVNAFIQASGATGTLSTRAVQAALPPVGQGVGLPTDAATRQTASPAGQSSPDAANVYAATTHVTPQLTPQLSVPSQQGASVLDAPTRFISPAPAAAQGNMAAAFLAPPVASEISTTSPGTFAPTAQTIQSPMQGWAAQIDSGPAPGPLATFETTSAGKPIVPSSEAGKERRGGGPRRWALAAAAALLLAVLIGGGVFAYAKWFTPAVVSSMGATVTITPQSSALQNSYNITAVTSGTPDPTQDQVSARNISVTTQAYSQTVNATGTAYTAGTQATGTLIIYNWDTANSLSLSTGGSYPNNNGDGNAPSSIVMVLDAAVNLPPAPGPGSYSSITIPGHVQQVGTIGNFPRFYLSSLLASSNGYTTPLSGGTGAFSYHYGSCSSCWEIDSYSAFSGGTDPQPYTVVAQSDIDNAATSLIQANQPNAQQEIQSQLQSGEQQIGTPQCSPNTSADHAAGDAASQVTVTVTFTCTGEAYSQQDALNLAKQLLTNDAQSKFGAQYALVGQITSSQVSAAAGAQGTVNLVVNASGTWAYQFSAAAQQHLATLIAGKTASQARDILRAQPGIADVDIQISGGNGQPLPAKAQEIKIEIKAVTGA